MELSLITLINSPIHLLTWEQACKVKDHWLTELSRGAFDDCDKTIDRAIMELGLLNRHLHLTYLRRQQWKNLKQKKNATGWQFMPFKSLVVGYTGTSPSIPEKPSTKGNTNEIYWHLRESPCLLALYGWRCFWLYHRRNGTRRTFWKLFSTFFLTNPQNVIHY